MNTKSGMFAVYAACIVLALSLVGSTLYYSKERTELLQSINKQHFIIGRYMWESSNLTKELAEANATIEQLRAEIANLTGTKPGG